MEIFCIKSSTGRQNLTHYILLLVGLIQKFYELLLDFDSDERKRTEKLWSEDEQRDQNQYIAPSKPSHVRFFNGGLSHRNRCYGEKTER